MTISVLEHNILGPFKVNRAKADIFDGTTTALFTITGGKCAITSVMMEVKDGDLGAVANNVKLVANPTTGTSTDMCAVTDTTGDEEGSLYTISGTLADVLAGGVGGASTSMATPIIVNTGSIDLSSSGDNGVTNGATVQVVIFYEPVDDGANITAT